MRYDISLVDFQDVFEGTYDALDRGEVIRYFGYRALSDSPFNGYKHWAHLNVDEISKVSGLPYYAANYIIVKRLQ